MNWNRFKPSSLLLGLRQQISAGHASSIRRRRDSESGMTLMELVVACAILVILATAAVPIARNTIKWKKEEELRWDLRQMRDAIDRYKDASDKGQIQVKAGTEGYPESLDSLVKPTPLTGTTGTAGSTADKRIRFLREIPVDPLTKNKDWGLRSVQDDTDTTSWGGQDVFDVYSKSTGTALDGTKYSDW
jgi:general secretion pathway protein G